MVTVRRFCIIITGTMHVLTMNDCWAKADADGTPCVSVAEHCISVGYVATQLKSLLPLKNRSYFPEGGVILIAAHDIGKISPGFLLKSCVWRKDWQVFLNLSAEGHENRHAFISQKFLATRFNKPPRWIMSVGGHHGRYVSADSVPVEMPFASKSIGTGIFEELREELLDVLIKEFGPLPMEENVPKGAKLHWFTGAMIFCDWIGSNTTWFGATANVSGDLNSQARSALDELGIHHHKVRPDLCFADLFGFPEPRPLQKTLIEAMDTQGLYIVEAPMGEGKTEAALFGAYRRWSEGDERGLYFALPTQLSSNRIRDRVEKFFEKVVAEKSALALVHGNAWLTENRIRPLDSQRTSEDSPDNALEANSWFSDSRRAMLAPFGVGTIDQALMSVVPVKYSALRLFGLGGKVVVIDEVHSYDPYTSNFVDRLVKWLLELGGTVVVLSATLTAKRRATLVQAAGATEGNAPMDYPLVTRVASGSSEAVHIRINESTPTSRQVVIGLATTGNSDWLREVSKAAEAGACVLVIRNTVDLARDTHSALRSLCRDRGIAFGLIHSRFTQADRDANESKWTSLLGRDGADRPRRGAVLVGTQVLEQSLDIDADFLVTDLAPTELILQRMGRLHRHARLRPAGCEMPRCLILKPQVDWHAGRNEILDTLKPHHFIYPPFALYMAERIWSERKSVGLPGDIRSLLEESAIVPDDLSESVKKLWEEMEARASKMRTTAWMNDIFKNIATNDAEGAETRWNIKPSAHLVVLAAAPRQTDRRVEVTFPCGSTRSFELGLFDFPLARLLNLHAARVPAYTIRGLMASQPRWLANHMQDAVLAVRDQTNRLVPWPEDDHGREFSYSHETGLGISRSRTSNTRQMPEEDDTWY